MGTALHFWDVRISCKVEFGAHKSTFGTPPPFCGSIPQSTFPYIIMIILVMIDEVNMGRMVMRPQGDLRGFSVAGNAEV